MVTPDFQFNFGSLAGWEFVAQRLRDAPEALFRFHYDTLRQLASDEDTDLRTDLEGAGAVILLLAGLAIENLAKGLWVLEHPAKVVVSRRLPNELTGGHEKTVRLLDAVNAQLTPSERSLVLKLQTFVTWAGRYPTSRTIEKRSSESFMTDDFEHFSARFDRLRTLLKERWKQGLAG